MLINHWLLVSGVIRAQFCISVMIYNLFGVRWHTPTVTHQSVGNLDDFVVKHFRWNTSQLDFFGDCKPYQNDEIRFFFLFFALVKNVYRNNTSKILQILVIKLIFVLKIHFDFTSPLGSIVCVCLCVCVCVCVWLIVCLCVCFTTLWPCCACTDNW